ncbi:MAG: hypothetical protein HSCHL_0666 [Hydrogenibacillus schlegelii]|uniref:Uncharacterized protein n=1 Tax=Hydrogenibacillus schlegelii TaxID=1484 RepID=A0A2T5G7S8_HYDSH|nr:hypothetical protein [Hydrogenibacillus schlegelii]PTQ52245.1 MAG: hypothetical protein HSCHL_0666 [Hydrogenibacillus schlegelii]
MKGDAGQEAGRSGLRPPLAGLWLKEGRQIAGVTAAFIGAAVFWTAIRVMGQLDAVHVQIEEGFPPPYRVRLLDWPSFFFPAFVLWLAVVQLGGERSRGLDRLTFFLPYARRTVFAVKAALGAAVIAAALLLSALVGFGLVAGSPYRDVVVFDPALGLRLGTLFVDALALYALAMLMGAIAGSGGYQVALTIIFGVYPAGVIGLLYLTAVVHVEALHLQPLVEHWAPVEWLRAHLEAHKEEITDAVIGLSPLLHSVGAFVVGFPDPLTGGTDPAQEAAALWRLVPYDLGMTAAFLAAGAAGYAANRLELSRRMLVVPELRPLFLVGIPVHFALLGGLVASGFGGPVTGPGALVRFYFGAAVLGGVVYWGTRQRIFGPPRRRVIRPSD